MSQDPNNSPYGHSENDPFAKDSSVPPIPQNENPYGYSASQAPQNNPYGPSPYNGGNQNPQQYPQPQQGYNQYPQEKQFGNYTVQPGEAENIAQQAWIFGLIGIFVLGIVLGPIALYKAFKAKTLGANATAGFVLGSLALVLSLLNIIFVISILATM